MKILLRQDFHICSFWFEIGYRYDRKHWERDICKKKLRLWRIRLRINSNKYIQKNVGANAPRLRDGNNKNKVGESHMIEISEEKGGHRRGFSYKTVTFLTNTLQLKLKISIFAVRNIQKKCRKNFRVYRNECWSL